MHWLIGLSLLMLRESGGSFVSDVEIAVHFSNAQQYLGVPLTEDNLWWKKIDFGLPISLFFWQFARVESDQREKNLLYEEVRKLSENPRRSFVSTDSLRSVPGRISVCLDCSASLHVVRFSGLLRTLSARIARFVLIVVRAQRSCRSFYLLFPWQTRPRRSFCIDCCSGSTLASLFLLAFPLHARVACLSWSLCSLACVVRPCLDWSTLVSLVSLLVLRIREGEAAGKFGVFWVVFGNSRWINELR